MTSSNILIQRNRLTKLTDTLAGCRILYVQAPAGYGKTVFAGQWMAGKGGAGAVIALDEYDNSAADICWRLKNALEDLCPEEYPEKFLKECPEVFLKEYPEILPEALPGQSRKNITAFTRHPGFGKAPAEFLMRAVAALPRSLKAGLVVDDFHYITDVSAQKLFRDFLLRLPPGIEICMLSRCPLPESFSSLVLKNEIQFLSQEQLLFDSREICALYKSKNIAITPRQAEEVLELTEGWPMGINALLLSPNQLPTENLSPGWLESFLKTQVWEMWDERTKNFMLGTCIEEELSAEICSALTGEPDSAALLDELTAKGAFLYKQRGGAYRFHRLFREFLIKRFLEMPPEYRTSQIQKAGHWHLEGKNFYHAVERFSQIKDYEHVACCFDLLEEMDREGFDAEQVMHAVRSALDEEILERYPYLYFMMAFTARNEGRIEDFKACADNYYHNYPRIVQRNPELAHNIFFLYAMDFRVTLKEIAKAAAAAQMSGRFQGVRGSATLYFPFYHKAYKDFCELLPGDMEDSAAKLGQLLGPLLGSECPMLLDCILGGLYYEQGNMERAQELAFSAAAKVKNSFAPESKFCAMMLLLGVTHAMNQPEQEELLQRDIQKMIEDDKAFYLQFNFDTVLCKYKLETGDTGAAQRWVEGRGAQVYEHVDFLRLYGHFTTAGANIVLGDYGHAIILLKKVLELCKAMNRTTDIIEANILLAVAYWKKNRSSHKEAVAFLEEAVTLAQSVGYQQAFLNHGAELKNILSTLKNWTMRSDYHGELSPTFVRKLYIGASEKAGSISLIKDEKAKPEITLTQKQRNVAVLMCQGYSYRKIAGELGIQFSTVRSHIELIYRKLDVSSMDEAIRKIHCLHLLDES